MTAEEAVARFSPSQSGIKVSCHRESQTVTLSIAGALDLVAASEAQDLLATVLTTMKAKETLIIDIANVGYISSAGVGSLTTTLSNSRKKDIELKLRGIQPKVRSVFELLGFMSFFTEAP